MPKSLFIPAILTRLALANTVIAVVVNLLTSTASAQLAFVSQIIRQEQVYGPDTLSMYPHLLGW